MKVQYTKDGISIEATDGFLWTRSHSVGFTRLPPAALEAVYVLVPTVKYDALPALVKAHAKAAKLLGPRASAAEIAEKVRGGGQSKKPVVKGGPFLHRDSETGATVWIGGMDSAGRLIPETPRRRR